MILPAVTMLSTGLARQLPTSARIVTGLDPYNKSVVMFDSRMFPQPGGCALTTSRVIPSASSQPTLHGSITEPRPAGPCSFGWILNSSKLRERSALGGAPNYKLDRNGISGSSAPGKCI